MSVKFAIDRSICVQPEQKVVTDWIDIDLCCLGSRTRMSPEAVTEKYRILLQHNEAAIWPPIVGHWENNRFIVDDGRHEYLAWLMLGRKKIFVAWLT